MRVFLTILLIVVAGGAAYAWWSAEDGGSESPDRSNEAEGVDDSDLVDPGMAWTLTLIEQGPSVDVTPGASTIERIFDFEVVGAPADEGGEWTIRANERDAVGPAADGFELYYRSVGSGSDEYLELTGAAAAGRERVDARAAEALVGVWFPLETRIDTPPDDRTERRKATPDGAPPPGVLPPPG